MNNTANYAGFPEGAECPVPSKSKSKKPHKFFERYLNNDLDSLSIFLQEQYKKIEEGKLIKGKLEEKAFADSNSISTMNWYNYNLFQFYNEEVYNLFTSIREMTKEACEYYEIDYEKEKYYAQGWFNINYKNNGKLNWHDHSEFGAPEFHGYYSVSAEPSVTHYSVFNKYFANVNKNNRAVLSETGHPHAMGDWDWDGPRITIAYDITPFRKMNRDWEQHWIPL